MANKVPEPIAKSGSGIHVLPAFGLVGYCWYLLQEDRSRILKMIPTAFLGGNTVLSSPEAFGSFRYRHDETLMSQWTWPLCMCFGYLLSVFILSRYMKNRPARDLGSFRIFHNAFLCVGSFVMVLGMVMELTKVYQIGGAEAMYCDSERIQRNHSNLYNWYYVFYLSKYYEFIDTFILIMRKKPVSFLHVFHHFVTAFLCWLGLYDEQGIQWTVIALNGTVHVFMYYYYLMVSFNKDVWWKKYLTTMQIVQFCVDLLAVLPFFYSELVLKKDCSGTSAVLGFSHGILLSFLILFINFFRKTYRNDPKTSPHNAREKSIKSN
eukprot:TRINITY_DN8297_c0_g1_i1.p1 TRINITY_DN8297_c0_g1~~TRINITY_DN8297_c0_g1_i1.p1  ORF type:complete len:331 (+),score=60.86 TRINITY_DN8297_c0_g1_i1:32-994(+)